MEIVAKGEYELWAINARVVSDSDWMSRLGFPLIANNEVFEMLQNAKRGCGNCAPLGSYVTVAFAASLVGLHASHGAIYSLSGCNCISWFIGICLDVFGGFSTYLAVGWFALWQEFVFGDFRKDSPTLRRVPSVLRKVRFLGLGQSRF